MITSHTLNETKKVLDWTISLKLRFSSVATSSNATVGYISLGMVINRFPNIDWGHVEADSMWSAKDDNFVVPFSGAFSGEIHYEYSVGKARS